MASVAQKLMQAQASWGGLLYPIGVLFPGSNQTAAKVTAKIPVVGSLMSGLQQFTGVTTTSTAKKKAATKKKAKKTVTKKKQSSKKAKKATKNKKR